VVVFFGSIPHADLLKSVARRIVDWRVLHRSRPSSWWRFEAEAEAPRVRRGWGGKSSAVGAF
jgi:hypothetical protein